jgi:hypothetical protein
VIATTVRCTLSFSQRARVARQVGYPNALYNSMCRALPTLTRRILFLCAYTTLAVSYPLNARRPLDFGCHVCNAGVRAPQFLALLLKSMKGDVSAKRVAAFAKRLLQARLACCCHSCLCITCTGGHCCAPHHITSHCITQTTTLLLLRYARFWRRLLATHLQAGPLEHCSC